MNRPEKEYLEIACSAAARAARFIREMWERETSVERKEDDSLLTEIDLGSESLIRDVLGSGSRIPILGEEEGATSSRPEEGLWWYVDPVDGTTNLAHRFPWVCVSVALMEDGEPVVAVVHNPILEHVFSASRGGGAFLNQEPMRVSTVSTLRDSLLATGFAVGSLHNPETNNVPLFTAVMDKCQAVRRPGSAALDLASVAAGWFDGYWELGLKPWDTAAGWLLVTEAGGEVSLLDGDRYSSHTPQILATNGRIHRELSEVIHPAWQGSR